MSVQLHFFFVATCETSQVLLAGVSGGFPGVLPFRPTYRFARLYELNNLERDIKMNQKIFSDDDFTTTAHSEAAYLAWKRALC